MTWAPALEVMLGALVAAAGPGQGPDRFDHERHRKVFPECGGCHQGVTQSGRPVFPGPAGCAECHDGLVQRRVDWAGPERRASNLRFTHLAHSRASGARLPADSALDCAECHLASGSGWHAVRRTIPGQCLACHGVGSVHLAVPDTACATCHLSLAQAVELPAARVAAFGRPASHRDRGYGLAAGHGRRARLGDRSCAVCHARDFCVQCHVNAPEVPPIQALAPDRRSLELQATLRSPDSHRGEEFLARHAPPARHGPGRCVVCHTRESCIVCHRADPGLASALPAAGPGRAQGARPVPKPPVSHRPGFADRHAAPAGATTSACATCHQRAECLACHRPAAAGSGYHPTGFLARHPTWAFQRPSDCAGCHNQNGFCVACHRQSGLTAAGPLLGGYHDANRAFLLNHGTAARQSIESCITCHAERDCLACHSARTGRRFNPHGPGFDAEALRRRNPQTCAPCHGRSIPGRAATPPP